MAYGTLTNLVAGTATLTQPSSVQFMFIVNLDTAPLLLQFMKAGVQIGQIALSAATATGAPGGYLDSINFPLFFDATSIVLTSTVATAEVGCGSSTTVPIMGAIPKWWGNLPT